MPARKRYRLLLSAVVLLALLSVLILSLPVYRFDLTVHTKRSGNTFVGDERYVAARAEVDALAADYAARGIHTEITEEIIERVNSKGETTSLIVFRVNRETDCSGWDFIRSGFPSGKVLLLFLALEGLALLLALGAGLDAPERKAQDLRRVRFRQAAAWLLLACILLSVFFVLYTNVIMYRRIGLYASGVAESPGDAVLAAADNLICQGAGGEDTVTLLKDTASRTAWTWWLQIPVLLGMIALLVYMACGEIRRIFLRGALYAFVIAMCVFILYPFVIMFTSAFRTDADASDIYYLHIFPVDWHWENFSRPGPHAFPRPQGVPGIRDHKPDVLTRGAAGRYFPAPDRPEPERYPSRPHLYQRRLQPGLRDLAAARNLYLDLAGDGTGRLH